MRYFATYFLSVFFLSFPFLLQFAKGEEPKGLPSLPAAWTIPEAYHDVFELVAEFIPNLHNQNIVVRAGKLATTMNVRPSLFSLLFKNRDKRTYVIRVNTDSDFNGVLYEDVPELARVGLVMHELMHIKDYKSRNFFGVLQRGMQYLSVRGKTKFEQEIDRMVIEEGMRNYLFLWALYIMEESDAGFDYKEFKRSTYLTPAEIFIDFYDDGVLQDMPLIL